MFSRSALVFAFMLVTVSVSSLNVQLVYPVPKSNMLNVPYHSQFESGDPNQEHFCAPANVEMALEYVSGKAIQQTTLAVEMDTRPGPEATSLPSLRIPFDNRGYTAVKAGGGSTLDKLKALNTVGYVSIIVIYFDTNHKLGHAVVVTGYNETGIIVNDPWPTSMIQPLSRRTGNSTFISNQLLADLWTKSKQWLLEIPYPLHAQAYMVPMVDNGVQVDAQLNVAQFIERIFVTSAVAVAIIRVAAKVEEPRTSKLYTKQLN